VIGSELNFLSAASQRIHNENKEWFVWGNLHHGVPIGRKGKNADPELADLTRVVPPYPNGPLYSLHTKTARWIVHLGYQGKYQRLAIAEQDPFQKILKSKFWLVSEDSM
jgi:hypothetical protein